MRAAIVFFFFLISLQVFAQTSPAFTARAEFPVRNLNSGFEMFPLPDSSVLVVNQETYFRYPADKFTFYKLDAELNTVWSLPADLPKGLDLAGAAIEKDTAYLLFRTFKASEWLLVRLHLLQPRLLLTRHRLPPKILFELLEFKVLNGFLFLAGQQNHRLAVFHLHPPEKTFTLVPAIYDQFSALTEFHVDRIAERAEIVLTDTNGQLIRLQVKRLSAQGQLRSFNFIQSQHDFDLLAGRLTSGDSTRKLVIGTYGLRDQRYAQGFFVTPLVQPGGQPVQLFHFSGFQHYFDHLPSRRQSRLKDKVKQLQAENKLYRFKNKVLLHQLRPYSSGHLLIAEIYTPHFQGTSGRPGHQDGYDYNQSLVAAFGPDGELWWDNSFPIRNMRRFELQETVTAGIFGKKVILCYLDGEKIRYKIISGPETTSNDLYIELTKALPGEKIYNNVTDGIKHWYGPHFLVSGNQQVRMQKGSRHIYRIDKLTF